MINNRYREETGPVEIDIRIQEVFVITIEQFGARLRDIGISQVFAYHRAVLGLHQAVIIGVSGSGFGEANQ